MNRLKRIPKVSLSLLIICMICFFTGSDHADPIDPFNRERLEGGLTDLFAFPVDENGVPVFPWTGNQSISLTDPLKENVRETLSADQQSKMHSLVLILCARRQLTKSGVLNLEPYRYRIHIDVTKDVNFGDLKTAANRTAQTVSAGGAGYSGAAANESKRKLGPDEAFLRYGGLVGNPADIDEDLTIEFRLEGEAKLKSGYPEYSGSLAASLKSDSTIGVRTGVFDDPFIFPAFFGTNVVGMVVRIPLTHFDKNDHFLIWGTSHKGSRQIDHVGRSLRTQNPRFEMLNKLHPRDHAKAIDRQHENPSLMSDLAQRFNLTSLYGLRAWDFDVPDVMIYSRQFPVGFPNGRLLTDDVAALLAQLGDTLLFELSWQHKKGTWPRQTKNDMKDGKFLDDLPYLLDPWPNSEPPGPLHLTWTSRFKLLGIAGLFVVALVFENWLVARWYHSRKNRRRYL